METNNMIYQQTNSQGFHIGTNAEQKPGAVDTSAPVYDRETERAKWDGTQWIVKTKTEWDAPPPEPTEAEKLEQWRASARVSRRQAKQALVLAGMYGSVQPSIDGIVDETERLLAQIFWDDSNVFERNNTQLIAIAEALELTPEQIDDLFTQAVQL